jgi:hypothetical protein
MAKALPDTGPDYIYKEGRNNSMAVGKRGGKPAVEYTCNLAGNKSVDYKPVKYVDDNGARYFDRVCN